MLGRILIDFRCIFPVNLLPCNGCGRLPTKAMAFCFMAGIERAFTHRCITFVAQKSGHGGGDNYCECIRRLNPLCETINWKIFMKLNRRNCLAVASSVVLGMYGSQAFARSSTIKVTLWDKGAASMSTLGHGEMMGMGMEKMRGHISVAPMGVRLSSQTVSAGEVRFEVTNGSKHMVHEMVVSPVKDEKTPLPYDKAGNKVDEDAAGHLGEVAELEPGKKGGLKLTLKPGRYILYCNIPGHYALGMWTLLTVK